MSPHTIETVRLLAVSRDSAVLRLLWSIANSNSWHLETAANGWDAMERVQSDVPPDLLLLIFLPAMPTPCTSYPGCAGCTLIFPWSCSATRKTRAERKKRFVWAPRAFWSVPSTKRNSNF